MINLQGLVMSEYSNLQLFAALASIVSLAITLLVQIRNSIKKYRDKSSEAERVLNEKIKKFGEIGKTQGKRADISAIVKIELMKYQETLSDVRMMISTKFTLSSLSIVLIILTKDYDIVCYFSFMMAVYCIVLGITYLIILRRNRRFFVKYCEKVNKIYLEAIDY